jgi:hypothetical protein
MNRQTGAAALVALTALTVNFWFVADLWGMGASAGPRALLALNLAVVATPASTVRVALVATGWVAVLAAVETAGQPP